MLEFIQTLLHSYQRILNLNPHNTQLAKLYPQRIDQLTLAEALIRKTDLLRNSPDLPLQVAVIGPTQAGKSSLVNVLLHSQNAEVSPLAGYTVHAQGFCHEIKINQCIGLQQYFGRFQQLTREQLSRERFDCYVLSETHSHSICLPPCVVWDTPDFDSIGAIGYKEGVIRTIALADIVILVVSKEKYADQSVWDMMAAIAPLKQPTLICVNKLAEGTESLIINSLQEKWRQARTDDFPVVVPLFYQKPVTELHWPEVQQNVLKNMAVLGKQRQTAKMQQAYLQHYWSEWLEPVRAEHAAVQEWAALCQAEINLAKQHYQRDFLHHPHYYETFQNALVELLNLLEIPGMAAVLANTRKVLVWPVKQLMKLGRRSPTETDSSQEVQLLTQIAEHLLIQLADQILEKTTKKDLPDWWKEIALLLRQQRPEMLQTFRGQATSYHEQFKEHIEATAQRLYVKLQEMPYLLNSLRATRVSADAAVIALTIKTGGIGAHDLLLAPAMLAVTSFLTESALGSYMHRIEADLKQQQLTSVMQLFANTLQQELLRLPAHISTQQLFQITPEQLQQTEQYFSEKRHGLRFI